MECDSFPCCLCDNLNGSACAADLLGRDLADIPVCPLSETGQGKPDIGCWVVRQPDGKFCYYDENAGKIEMKDLDLQEIVIFREKKYGIPHSFAEKDTLSQVKFQVIRWEDITR